MNTPEPVIVEDVYPVSAEALWKAITDRDEMIQWFFEDIPEFKAETGFKTQFNVNTGERDFLHLWTITDVVPGQKIVYDWRYEGFEGAGTVTFEVSGEGENARLRVTTEGVESFTADIPEFERQSCVDGWKYFVQQSLKFHLTPDE